jgi:hypothetical protein
MKKHERTTKGFPAMAGQVVQLGQDRKTIVGSASLPAGRQVQALVSADSWSILQMHKASDVVRHAFEHSNNLTN